MKMIDSRWICVLVMAGFVLAAQAENMDPYDDGSQYAWSENTGWLNFEPSTAEVHVYSDRAEGYVWGENIGWINLSPSSYGGVINDGDGNLSGYAWGENVGWINFNPVVSGDPTDYGVSIDEDGNFDGWAWGENIGWIRFESRESYNVQTCVVNLHDLCRYALYWLRPYDYTDFDDFGEVWLDYCPDGWVLK